MCAYTMTELPLQWKSYAPICSAENDGQRGIVGHGREKKGLALVFSIESLLTPQFLTVTAYDDLRTEHSTEHTITERFTAASLTPLAVMDW